MSALRNNRPRYPALWDYTQPTGHLNKPTEGWTLVGVMLEVEPSTSLGSEAINGMQLTIAVVSPADDKNSDENKSGDPKKKGRPSASRVPGVAQPIKWTCRSPRHEDPKITQCYIQGGGMQSGEARVHDSARSIPSTN